MFNEVKSGYSSCWYYCLSAIVASISPATPVSPSLTDDAPAAAVIARHLVFS